MNDFEPKVVVVEKKKQGYGRYWPLWIQIGSFVGILIWSVIARSIQGININADAISMAEIITVLCTFAVLIIAFLIGIIGVISFGKKGKELGKFRVHTLVASILNILLGACAIGFILLLLLAIFSGVHV